MSAEFGVVLFCTDLLVVCSAMDVAPKFTVNQSRPEEITIKEDYNPIKFITDDGFGMSTHLILIVRLCRINTPVGMLLLIVKCLT